MYPQKHHRLINLMSSLAKNLLGACILLLLVQVSTYAQNDSVTPLGLKAGAPVGSYEISNIDTVNLFNGRVTVRIPLINYSGRGQAKTQTSWTWDIPARWQIYKSTDGFGNPVYGAGFGSARFDGSSSVGFQLGQYGVFPLGTGWGGPIQCDIEGVIFAWEKTLTRLVMADPDGTEHEMRDVLTNGQPLSGAGCSSGWPGHSVNRGRVFVTTDGSGATFVADDPIRDGAYAGFEYPYNYDDDFKGWLFLKDGRRIRISWDNNRALKDRNGNQFKFPFMGTQTDSLNRSNGAANLTSTQCSAIIPGETTCSYHSYKGYGGTERRIHFFFDQNSRLTRILLPNGRSYVLYYNNYDDLTRIDLPTGGSIEYDSEAGLQGNHGDFFAAQSWWPPGAYNSISPNDGHFYRRVTERRVYREGHVLESKQTFSKPESNHTTSIGYVEKKNYDGNNVLLSTERHYFYGNAEHSFWLNPNEYSSWLDGHEYKTETYDASGNLMKTVLTSWEQRASVGWWTGSSNDAPQNDPRISQVTTVHENGAQYTNSYAYDPNVPYNSLIDVIERDYNLNILRRKQTTYLKTLNGVDYAGLNIQNSSALHIRDLPLQESIIGWGNVEEARTTYEYDNYTTNSTHALLVARANISGLDPAFTTGYVTRGNATAITRHLLTNGIPTGSVTSYLQYDVAGNVVKTINARGNVTTYDFTDRFGSPNAEAQLNTSPAELSSAGQSSYAFPTMVTNAMNFTTYYQFDFYIGQAVDCQDVNGIVSSAYFNDLLDRPSQLIAASSNTTLKTQTSFAYDDVNRVITTTSDLSNYQDGLKKIDVRYDGLGRTIESRTYETASNYIATKKNSFGLTSQTSNPYRPWQGESPQWTTTVVDALGRIKTVTTPDNAVTSTSYTGNETMVTDPTGRKRKSISDSLGRVSYIYEDPLGANYQTIYGYNSLGNLISVSQDYLSQPPRAFSHDSLGRLVSATNPESGLTTFQYDEVGNLIVKTDARGVSIHYSYDALNRPIRRWYNSSSATTATTHNSPALPSGVSSTDELKYFYDAQSLPGGAPTFVRGASNGALVALTYGGGTDGNYLGRDAIGRQSLKIQRTSGVDYQMSLAYNNVGAVTSLVYPSGQSVSYAYDGAGRLNSLTGTLGDGITRTYSTGILYSPFGGISKEQFGTNSAVYNKLHYNIRGQLYDVRISNVNEEWSGELGALANYYSTNWSHGGSGTDNNGNVLMSQTIINSYYMEDRYTYDALNRLSSVSEYQNGSTLTGMQAYAYDRWGNRTISPSTWGTGITNKQFTWNSSTNRLGVPTGQSGTMTYDAAGNLTTDTYSGAGNRGYDGENRMTSAAGNTLQTQLYVYDAAGERVKRTVNGVTTWQVHGFSGELLAEYPASGPASSPQKEYGYRNGQLLVTTSGAGCGSGYAGMKSWSATSGSLGHNTGQQEGTDWAAYVSTHSAQHMVYGPYDTSFGKGHHQAQFQLQVDNTTGTDVVATIDVVIGYGTNVLAQRQIRRNEFTAANTWQWFTLDFDHPCFGRIETRLWFNDTTNLKFRESRISSAPGSAVVNWMVVDHLGSPRMVLDQSGTLTNIKRHDYLPFGEEIPAGAGGRSSALGYNADTTRQRFAGYEADFETDLNYAQARYQSSVQGRFTSTDPISGNIADPQSWNMYSYVGNNPVNRTDPTGMSYFMGSGANDPFIRENQYRVDGFDMPPPGTASSLTDESMLTFAPNWALLNEGLNITSSTNSGATTTNAAPPEPPPPGTGFGYMVEGWRATSVNTCNLYQVDAFGGKHLISSTTTGLTFDLTAATIVYSPVNTARPLNSTVQPKYGKRQGDDRGHIIGQALGGPPVPINLFSQSPTWNRGAYRVFETGIRQTLTAHQDWKAHVLVILTYPKVGPQCTGGSFRPNAGMYIVNYSRPDGSMVKGTVWAFKNP
ncbi:MAG TPA: RHS repeat-associated core domain-containing protein [Pyrinomonadaceae bacterium]|nr:RHS repeat-associated core domain-containing protein [Pyrinomonadaceae bacterium]